jgi:tetratricopeptide (TPR) repeat protein
MNWKEKYIDQPKKTAMLVIAVLVAVMYFQTVGFDNYVLDDHLYVPGNSFVTRGIGCDFGTTDRLSWDCIQENFKNIFGKDVLVGYFQKENTGGLAGGRFRPLSLYTFAIEYEIFEGPSPQFSHFINLLLYSGICFLVFLISHQLVQKYELNTWIPLIIAVLYCAHPLHVEVVANIKGRMEMMATLFAFAGTYGLLKYLDSSSKKHLFLSLFSFFLGMLSKEETVTFLAIIPCLILMLKGINAQSIKKSSWFLIPFALYFVIRAQVFGDALNVSGGSGGEDLLLNNPFIDVGFSEKYATIFYTWWRYLELTIIPFPLTHDYYPKHIPIVGFGNIRALLGVLFALGSVAIMLIWRKKYPLICFGVFWYWVTFSITSNFVFNVGTFMNERFQFIPSFGLIVALVLLIHLYLKNVSIKKFLFVGFTLVFVGLSFTRAQVWESNYKLFSTDVEVSKNSIKSNMELADELIARGEKQNKPQFFADAIPYLEKAKSLDDNFVGPHDLMGKVLFYQEKYDDAAEAYWGGIEIGIRNNLRYKNLEQNFFICIEKILENNQSDKAGKLLNKFEKTYPNQLKLLELKGRLLAQFKNDFEEALVYLQKAESSNPNSITVLKYVFLVYAQQGKVREAKDYAAKILKLNPTDKVVLGNLAYFYKANNMATEFQEVQKRLNNLQ